MNPIILNKRIVPKILDVYCNYYFSSAMMLSTSSALSFMRAKDTEVTVTLGHDDTTMRSRRGTLLGGAKPVIPPNLYVYEHYSLGSSGKSRGKKGQLFNLDF